jgi:hypothetical protein
MTHPLIKKLFGSRAERERGQYELTDLIIALSKLMDIGPEATNELTARLSDAFRSSDSTTRNDQSSPFFCEFVLAIPTSLQKTEVSLAYASAHLVPRFIKQGFTRVRYSWIAEVFTDNQRYLLLKIEINPVAEKENNDLPPT